MIKILFERQGWSLMLYPRLFFPATLSQMRHLMRVLRAAGATKSEYQIFIDVLTRLIDEYPKCLYDVKDKLKRNRKQLQDLQEKLYGGVK